MTNPTVSRRKFVRQMGVSAVISAVPITEAMALTIKTTVEEKKTVMALSGAIDIRGAGQLGTALTKVLESDSTEAIIDFEAVNFIGSAGVGKLLLFYKNFTTKGGRVTIINLNKEITALFKAIKLDKLFNI